jgi:hypothetical protein
LGRSNKEFKIALFRFFVAFWLMLDLHIFVKINVLAAVWLFVRAPCIRHFRSAEFGFDFDMPMKKRKRNGLLLLFGICINFVVMFLG